MESKCFYRASVTQKRRCCCCCMVSGIVFHVRELIPRLADQFRWSRRTCLVSDSPKVPEERKYAYSFDALAHHLEAFTDALGLNRYASMCFDYELLRACASRWLTRNESRRSCRRMAML